MKRKRLKLDDSRGNPAENHNEPTIRKRLNDSDIRGDGVSKKPKSLTRVLLSDQPTTAGKPNARAEKRSAASAVDEKVGPGNPPKHTRFRKGVSGNAKGRPKGSKNLATLVMEAANSRVAATIDGKQRHITKIQATTMQLATKGAQGDHKSMNKFLDLFDEIEQRAVASRPAAYPFGPADVQVIKQIYKRMLSCRANSEEIDHG